MTNTGSSIMAIKFKRLLLNPKDVVNGFHIAQLQDNVDLVFNQIQISNFQNGVFVVVTLSAGSVDNVVNHGLEREVQGWTVVDKNATADIWQSTTTNNLKTKQILLRASAAVTVKLYIF